jgi:hypothetical protein
MGFQAGLMKREITGQSKFLHLGLYHIVKAQLEILYKDERVYNHMLREDILNHLLRCSKTSMDASRSILTLCAKQEIAIDPSIVYLAKDFAMQYHDDRLFTLVDDIDATSDINASWFE